MLSNKGKYGLKAMLHLARQAPGRSALVADIAEANAIPRKFLDTILAELRNAGLVASRKGPGGGYALAREAGAITIGDIVRVLDGSIDPIACVGGTAYRRCEDCPDEAACEVRFVMQEVSAAISGVVDERSLADVCAATAERLGGFTYVI